MANKVTAAPAFSAQSCFSTFGACVYACVRVRACMGVLFEQRTSCTKWLEALTDIFMNLVVLEEVFVALLARVARSFMHISVFI